MVQAGHKNKPLTVLSPWRAVALLAVCFTLLVSVKTQLFLGVAVEQSASSPVKELVSLPYSERGLCLRYSNEGGADDDLSLFIYAVFGIADEPSLALSKLVANFHVVPSYFLLSSNTPRAPPSLS
jgi:hypothetical protein